MTTAVIIPARLASSRFPRKVLAPINGRPMVAWTYEAARQSSAEDVFVASGDTEVISVCATLGIPTISTRLAHHSGTDRVAEAATSLDHDIIVNLQADEPTIPPSTLDRLIASVTETKADMGSLMCPLRRRDEYLDPNRVKVVTTSALRALYFSRSPIPAQVADFESPTAFLHVGVYAFKRERLFAFSRLQPTPLEKVERLEQLRAIENGWHVQMSVTDWEPAPVDVIDDLDRAARHLAKTKEGIR